MATPSRQERPRTTRRQAAQRLALRGGVLSLTVGLSMGTGGILLAADGSTTASTAAAGPTARTEPDQPPGGQPDTTTRTVVPSQAERLLEILEVPASLQPFLLGLQTRDPFRFLRILIQRHGDPRSDPGGRLSWREASTRVASVCALVRGAPWTSPYLQADCLLRSAQIADRAGERTQAAAARREALRELKRAGGTEALLQMLAWDLGLRRVDRHDPAAIQLLRMHDRELKKVAGGAHSETGEQSSDWDDLRLRELDAWSRRHRSGPTTRAPGDASRLQIEAGIRARRLRDQGFFAAADSQARFGLALSEARGDGRSALDFRKLLLYFQYDRFFNRSFLPISGMLPEEPRDLAMDRASVLAEAERTLGEILRRDGDATALVDMGRLRIEQNRLEDARAFLLKALQAPGHEAKRNETATLLGLIDAGTGRQSEAERRLSPGVEDRSPPSWGSGRISLDQIGALAFLRGRQDRLERLEATLQRALEFSRELYGDSHPQTLLYRSSLAHLQIATGHPAAAGPLVRQLAAAQFQWLVQQLSLLPREQRLSLLAGQPDAVALSFALLDRDPSSSAIALETRLNRQGLLTDLEARQRLIAGSDPESRVLAERIAAIDRRLSTMTLSAEEAPGLREERRSREADLYRRIPDLRLQPVTVAQVAAVLPGDGALIEIQKYRPLVALRRGTLTWGEPRYIALLLLPDQRTRAIPLGSATALDAAVRRAVTITAAHSEPPEAAWQTVGELLLGPLQPHLQGRRQLFLSLDGELHRIPIALLPAPGQAERLLSEELQVRLITSGRDLIRLQARRGGADRAVVIANPDYGPGEAWRPLPNTQEEGEQVATILRSRSISGREATVSTVLTMKTPRILHIATHGFFQPAVGLTPSDPLSRTGLVFAGANRQVADSDSDAILTAAEATGLPLRGTDLVVLSACDTGLGDIQSGEGVYGLQRALTVAGSRAALLSLWSVNDRGTAQFMKRFYTHLVAGKGRAEALAATQAEFRQHPVLAFRDAYIWGAFQLIGDWTPLPIHP